MSTNGYTPAAAASTSPTSPAIPPSSIRAPRVFELPAMERERPKHRYWLHALLFLMTLLTTTMVGALLAHAFNAGRPVNLDFELFGRGSIYLQVWGNPALLLEGLPFSLTLLTILMAHEMGHYLTARYYRVDASLPFFIPAPTLIGTLGAFIRIRSAILSKRILFDIGIGGPLAGFVTLLIPMIAGVSMSKVIPGIAERGDLLFGTPLVLQFVERLVFPHASGADIYLHPVARAAWVGLLATALNLLPIGQLDGGHILYSFTGEKTKILSRIFVVALASLGAYQLFTSHYSAGSMWLLWAVVLLFLGMRHPSIVDPAPLSPVRRWLGLASLVIFVLTFTLAPIRIGS